MDRRTRGFTLLEVLVALAIFALVAASILTATSRTLINQQRLTEMTLGSWIADNRLSDLQLSPTPPRTGQSEHSLQFADRRWQLEQQVSQTRFPRLLQVEIWVATDSGERSPPRQRAVARLSGFIHSP